MSEEIFWYMFVPCNAQAAEVLYQITGNMTLVYLKTVVSREIYSLISVMWFIQCPGGGGGYLRYQCRGGPTYLFRVENLHPRYFLGRDLSHIFLGL